MVGLSVFFSNLAIAAVAVLLYAGAWWLSSGRPLDEKVATRVGLGLLLVLPTVLAVIFGEWRLFHPPAGAPPTATRGAEPERRAASEAERNAAEAASRRAAEAAKAAAEDAKRASDARAAAEAEAKRAADASAAKAEAERRAAAAKRAADEAAKADAERSRAEAKKAAGPTPADVARAMAEAERQKQEAAAPAERGATPATRAPELAAAPPPPVAEAPLPAAAPPAPPEPWDVVPVYYGTDRAREAGPEPVSYTAERGKRLDLGRALVTVPKSHQVPNVERPWVYKLPFTQIVIAQEKEDPAKHFTLKELKALSREEMISLVKARLAASSSYKEHAIVFVHGFNTSFEAAVYRTAQIAYDLKFDGAPFLYSWPSKGALGLQDYNYDRESTGQAEPYLRQFLELVTQETGAKTVSIIAHSMGNQLLLPVLREFKRTTRETAAISQIILAAPDVDRDNFEFLAKQIAGVSRGITMLASSTDRAMEASRRFWGGVPRAGDVPGDGPIVVDGVDTIDVTAVTTEIFAINHSGYAEKPLLLEDIQKLIQTGERPPEKRVPNLARVKTDKGEFWRYPSAR